MLTKMFKKLFLEHMFEKTIGPSSKMIPVRMSRNIAQGHILAQFTAEKIGEHSIDVKINGTKVTGSPFR